MIRIHPIVGLTSGLFGLVGAICMVIGKEAVYAYGAGVLVFFTLINIFDIATSFFYYSKKKMKKE